MIEFLKGYFMNRIFALIIMNLLISSCLKEDETISISKTKNNESGVTGPQPNSSEEVVNIPNTPSSLLLINPVASSSNVSTPTIQVIGVTSGDTVKLYSDNTCLSEVGSAVASSNEVNITTNALSEGQYTFYATTNNGENSNCSSSSVNYEYVESVVCPSGYIPVPANTDLSVDAFCVMKYEAKQNGSIATSTHSGIPWSSISAIDATTACKAQENSDPRYDIISNAEWMTIARNIEAQDANWSGGSVANGSIYLGHNDGSPNAKLAVSDPSNPYSDTSNSSPSLEKRTHILSNGEEIWDLGANVMEWVDWDSSDVGFTVGPTNCVDQNVVSLNNVFSLNCYQNTIFDDDFVPGNPNNVTPITSYYSNYGLGGFRGGSGGAALRGGFYYGGTAYAGIFAIITYRGPGSSSRHIAYGFRCVYRP